MTGGLIMCRIGVYALWYVILHNDFGYFGGEHIIFFTC